MKGKKTGGRRVGSQNKATAEIKELLRTALANKGDAAYFEKQADENPTAFMGLIGKIIPADVRANVQGNITFRWADE